MQFIYSNSKKREKKMYISNIDMLLKAHTKCMTSDVSTRTMMLIYKLSRAMISQSSLAMKKKGSIKIPVLGCV
jgi:hypothetical protein